MLNFLGTTLLVVFGVAIICDSAFINDESNNMEGIYAKNGKLPLTTFRSYLSSTMKLLYVMMSS